MIAHTSVTITDYEKSKALYTKMLAPLGYLPSIEYEEFKVAGYIQGGRIDFWIGEKPVPSAGVHVAFAAESAEQVHAFYEAALAAGATDNGAPGLREHYRPGYYGAFVLDFDGNNIEAVWMDQSAL